MKNFKLKTLNEKKSLLKTQILSNKRIFMIQKRKLLKRRLEKCLQVVCQCVVWLFLNCIFFLSSFLRTFCLLLRGVFSPKANNDADTYLNMVIFSFFKSISVQILLKFMLNKKKVNQKRKKTKSSSGGEKSVKKGFPFF